MGFKDVVGPNREARVIDRADQVWQLSYPATTSTFVFFVVKSLKIKDNGCAHHIVVIPNEGYGHWPPPGTQTALMEWLFTTWDRDEQYRRLA